MVATRLFNTVDATTKLRYTNVCAIGDSLTAARGTGGSYYETLCYRHPRFVNKGNFGVAGERSDQILARISSVTGSGAQFCFGLFGINDILQGVAEATLRANFATFCTTLRAAGIEPIIITLPPNNTPGNVPRIVAHNVWRNLYCRYNGITLVDIWPALATGAGAYQSAFNDDGLHWNFAGSGAVAELAQAAITSPYVMPPLLAQTDTGSDAGCFFDNAVSFAGGAPPTGWFANGTGGTYAVNGPDTGGFGKWFRCTMSGAGADVGFNPTAVTVASQGWTVGDRLIFGANIRWVDTSQALSVTAMYTVITPSGQPLYQWRGGATGDNFSIFRECTFNSGTVLGFDFKASGTGYFEVNRPIVVNKTMYGF